MLIRHFQRPGHRLQIELAVQLPQRLLQPPVVIGPSGQAEKNVFPNRQIRKQHRFLGNKVNAQLMSQRRVETRKSAAAKNEFTLVGRFHPGDNLHQRRFSRAITAHQRMHLAGKEREINAL